jgi:hypothetical protein
MSHLTVLLGILNKQKMEKQLTFNNFPINQPFIHSVQDTKVFAFNEFILFKNIWKDIKSHIWLPIFYHVIEIGSF